jgi:predicted N-acetyltransferase YhbS
VTFNRGIWNSFVVSAMDKGMQIRIANECGIDPAMDASIRAGLCQCFPPDRESFAQSRAWHGSLPDWTAVIQEGGEVIAYTGVVERIIRVGHDTVRVAGVQNVFVLPDHRGQGLCRQLMMTTMAEAEHRGVDFGLLFCTFELSTIYSNLDWRRLDRRTILRIASDGREVPIPKKNLGMFYPVTRDDFPAGEIHLQGNDW